MTSSPTLTQAAQEIAQLFVLEDGFLQRAVDEYIKQSLSGLAKVSPDGMPMIPSFITKLPTGKETGTFLALDLGGTNFRVCSVELHGNSTFSIVQQKKAVSNDIMKSDLKTFISHLGDRIEEFLIEHHAEFIDKCKDDPKHAPLRVGFTFSFPLNQTSVNRGTLIRWTKGFDIQDAVGQDILLALQEELDSRKLKLYIAAVINDTVGSLLCRSFSKPQLCGPTIVGCVFGTGTNGAYSEPLENITKLSKEALKEVGDVKDMVINTEWGSFDNQLKVIPNTKYDAALDLNTPNKGYHMFEKRVSGMFLGELLRLTMLDLYNEGLLFTSDAAKSALSSKSNALFTPWSMNTAVPAAFHGDLTPELKDAAKIIKEHVGFDVPLAELSAIQVIAKAIGTRSAHMSAIPIAGAILHSKALDKHDTIDIGADGSVAEHYPHFQEMIFDGLAKTSIGHEGVARITMGIAKDGSGVGAALCALEAK